MRGRIAAAGYSAGLAAFAAALAYDVAQTLQVIGALRFPFDEIVIYGTSLCIVVPFVLEMLAFHHLTDKDRQFFTHAAVFFTFLYAAFVTANYVVQLATVIPAKLAGDYESIRLLDQTPHSLFWNFDAIGYISMGFAMLVALPALSGNGFERWVRLAFVANVLVTPLIAIVYFYPVYTNRLLILGYPWAFTAPISMVLLAVLLRKRRETAT